MVTSVRPPGPPGHGLNECLVLVEIPPPLLCFPPLFLTQRTLTAHHNPICWSCRAPAKTFTKNSSLCNYVDKVLILVSIINMMMHCHQSPMETPDWSALRMNDFYLYFFLWWNYGDSKASTWRVLKMFENCICSCRSRRSRSSSSESISTRSSAPQSWKDDSSLKPSAESQWSIVSVTVALESHVTVLKFIMCPGYLAKGICLSQMVSAHAL